MFTITEDYTDDSQTSVKWDVWPASCSLTGQQIVSHSAAQKFEMYDADGNLFYEGAFIGQDDFEPMDLFGLRAGGCVEAKFT